MAYQLIETLTSIRPAGATPFDEWFDALPIDYFKDNPAAEGKNKFELLEDLLSPPPAAQRVVENEVKVTVTEPRVTKETRANDDGNNETITIFEWDTKEEYAHWAAFNDIIYTNMQDVEMTKTMIRLAPPNRDWPEEYKINIDTNINKFVVSPETKTYMLNTYGIEYIDNVGEVYFRYTGPELLRGVLIKKYDEIFGITETETSSTLET